MRARDALRRGSDKPLQTPARPKGHRIVQTKHALYGAGQTSGFSISCGTRAIGYAAEGMRDLVQARRKQFPRKNAGRFPQAAARWYTGGSLAFVHPTEQ